MLLQKFSELRHHGRPDLAPQECHKWIDRGGLVRLDA